MSITKKTYVNDPKDIPTGEHYAILFSRSTFVPGDERSRTNPGHGYGDETVKSWDYVVYPNRQEWEKEISELSKPANYQRNRFVPLISSRPVVEMSIVVKITDAQEKHDACGKCSTPFSEDSINGGRCTNCGTLIFPAETMKP